MFFYKQKKNIFCTFLNVSCPHHSHRCQCLHFILVLEDFSSQLNNIKTLKKKGSVCHIPHVCRHQSSGDSPVKRWKYKKLSSVVDIRQLMKAAVLAKSSSYFIFSPGPLRYCDVYRRESGRCLTLPFFLTFFIISPFQVFSFILIFC